MGDDGSSLDVARLRGKLAAIAYNLRHDLWVINRNAARRLRRAIAAILLVPVLVALLGCSRPPPPHPETVAPATDDHPAEECPGGMCELPKPKR